MAGILAVLVLGWAGTSQAQDTRLAAFALHCFVPITSDMHTRAVLVGKIILANRTDWFVSVVTTAHPHRGSQTSW
jgi:hypothetical protein